MVPDDINTMYQTQPKHVRLASYLSVPKSTGSYVEIDARSFNPDEQEESPDFVPEEPSYLEDDDASSKE